MKITFIVSGVEWAGNFDPEAPLRHAVIVVLHQTGNVGPMERWEARDPSGILLDQDLTLQYLAGMAERGGYGGWVSGDHIYLNLTAGIGA